MNESLFRYLDQLPEADFAGMVAGNLLAYVSWLVDKGYREAMAQFCNVFENAQYSHANFLILQAAPEVYARISDFISNL